MRALKKKKQTKKKYIYIYIYSLNYSNKNTLYSQFAQIVHPQLSVKIGNTEKSKISK